MHLAAQRLVPCAGCGLSIDASTADLSTEGDAICPRCNGAAAITTDERRAVTAMQARAWGNLGLGLFAWFVNPFWACSIIAVVNGVMIAQAMNDDWYIKRMPEGRGTVSGAAIAGAVLSLVPTLLVMLSVVR